VSGFCARHLVTYLASIGNIHVFGFDLFKNPPEGLKLNDYITVDIKEYEQVANAIRFIQPELIFHLAGIICSSAVEVYHVNLLGGINLLESVREFVSDARILLVGSAAEYGNIDISKMPITEDYSCQPTGSYGLSKYALTLAALDYAHNYNMKVTVARPFNIIGAGIPSTLIVGAILKRIKQALAGSIEPTVTVGNLDTERDFIAVEDVVEGYVHLIQGEHWGEVFNICSGQTHSIRSIVKKLFSFSNRPIHLKPDPTLMRSSDIKVIYGSWEKAYKAFAFKPKISLERALKSAWDNEIKDKN
jgi:GDP-4-dehydro-6-deoxy-D-mannose reductase